MKFPAYLKPGDTIAIVCPAGYLPAAKAKACINTLKKWGFKVTIGKTLGGKSKNYFSGSFEERLADLQNQIDDPSVNAILCGRGGYGTTHLLDHIDWKKFKKNPKWIIGFSDITILHNYVQGQLGIATIHGPMANAFNEGDGINRYTLSLKDTLEGKPTQYTCSANQLNRRGKTKAPVVGGNLSLLAHAVGTNAELNTDGKILFIEDIGEQIYAVDRMLYQLKRSGKLQHLAGLVIGGFTDIKDTDRPFGKTVYEAIAAIVAEYNYPVCYNFPVSHGRENVALKVGIEYALKVGNKLISLSEF